MTPRKRAPRRYAEGTNVSVDASRAELEKLLERHGATHFGVYREPDATKIIFCVQGRFVRQTVTVPVTSRKAPIPNTEKEFRRRWRALLLITRAKLEMVAAGDSTIEREFLADTVLADGATVYERAAEQIAESYATGVAPRLMLGPGR